MFLTHMLLEVGTSLRVRFIWLTLALCPPFGKNFSACPHQNYHYPLCSHLPLNITCMRTQLLCIMGIYCGPCPHLCPQDYEPFEDKN